MTAVKIVFAVLGCFAISLFIAGVLGSANNPKNRPVKFYKKLLFSGITLFAMSLCLHLFI